MNLLAFNHRTGSIETYAVSIPAFAKDVGRCLIKSESTGVYRVQLVDPVAGNRVLWDSDTRSEVTA